MSQLLICSPFFVPTEKPISAPTIMPANPHEANKASESHSFAVLFLRLLRRLRPREWRLDLFRLEDPRRRPDSAAGDDLAGSLAVFEGGFSSSSLAATASPEAR